MERKPLRGIAEIRSVTPTGCPTNRVNQGNCGGLCRDAVANDYEICRKKLAGIIGILGFLLAGVAEKSCIALGLLQGIVGTHST